jgi:hypothetical protein
MCVAVSGVAAPGDVVGDELVTGDAAVSPLCMDAMGSSLLVVGVAAF